jgi:chromosome segregation ATPase
MNASNWMSGELRNSTEKLINTNINAEAAAKAREKAEKALQESLQAQYDDLQKLLKMNLSQNYEDMVEKIEQVNEKQSELKERIADVNDEIAGYRAEIQEIKDEEGPVTAEQSERIGEYNERIAGATVTLGELKGELGEIPSAIDEVREAWDKQTKQMIFDLAAQRLAADGLTSEEMEALGKLAGPQGFDLIDESSQRMIEGIALAADEMSKAGDQSDIFIEVLKDIQEEMGNTEYSVEQLGEAINDLPTKWELAIEYSIGELPELRGKKLMEYESWNDAGIGNVAIPQSAPAGASNNNYNLTVNTSAPSEPIVSDFEMLAGLGLER